MYECSICLSLNHASHFTCQNCGTIPAKYSPLKGRPSRMIEHNGRYQFIEVVAAYGVSRAAQHHAQRVYLRTVELDYYAE